MRLPAHFVRAEGVDVEDGAVGGEEGVEGEAEVGFGEFFGEVGEVESVGAEEEEEDSAVGQEERELSD